MVVPTMSIGGMEVLVLGLSRELIARGHHAEILCTEYIGGLEARVRAVGVPCEVVPAAGLSTIINPSELAARMKRGRFDVIHSHSGVTAKAARAARMAGIAGTVNTLHGFAHGWGAVDHVLHGLGCYQTDVVVGCSEDTADYLRRLLPGASNRVHLVRNGLDVVSFMESSGGPSLREELQLPAGAHLLGSVGRLDPIKNQQLMIEAIGLLDESWHLVIVGDGPSRADLEARIASAGLSSRVHLVGARTVNIDTYRGLDTFVMSSTSEAMPMAILEAFTARIPVVSSAVGGIPSLLHNGRTGLMFPSGDAAGLAEAVRSVMRDRAATEQRVRDAHEQLMSTHTLAAMTSEYERLYAKAMARR